MTRSVVTHESEPRGHYALHGFVAFYFIGMGHSLDTRHMPSIHDVSHVPIRCPLAPFSSCQEKKDDDRTAASPHAFMCGNELLEEDAVPPIVHPVERQNLD